MIPEDCQSIVLFHTNLKTLLNVALEKIKAI